MAYLKINGTDYSAILTKYDWTETPRQIDGPNVGVAINGDEIYDIVNTKFDFLHGCKAMTKETYKQLCDLMKANPLTVEYDSGATNSNRVITAKLTVSAANKVIETSERTILNGVTLFFKQK